MGEISTGRKSTKEAVELCCAKSIRERFDLLLLQKKIRQVDLAAKLGVDRAYVCRIVNAKELPPLEIKLKIAEILGVDSVLIWRT